MCQHLPAGNPAERELGSQWDDATWIAYDQSVQLRNLVALFVNVYRAKDTQPVKPTYLDRPGTELDPVTAEQLKQKNEAEKADLLRVLARPNPK